MAALSISPAVVRMGRLTMNSFSRLLVEPRCLGPTNQRPLSPNGERLTSFMAELRVVRQLGVFGFERHGECRTILGGERDQGCRCLVVVVQLYQRGGSSWVGGRFGEMDTGRSEYGMPRGGYAVGDTRGEVEELRGSRGRSGGSAKIPRISPKEAEIVYP